ncbi:hypothetical protein [Methylobacterium radiotolerans]|uniref:hypothetical protein n=1 Tax=Methylobacterium radiotolerans TaxID=31998 RepID=UPI001F2B4A0B|nr:hypothetical protein [Methylobacterium radiotolerans]UIY44114.1 hypothetical protein LZ599_10685 [Methylobacterium radiotolerans]
MLSLDDRPTPAPAFVPVPAILSDPVTEIAIAGSVTAELSETHVRFRADDGLVWAVPKSLIREGDR